MRLKKRYLLPLILLPGLGLGLVALFLGGILKNFSIPTGGMAPTIQAGDFVFASKSFRTADQFKRSQVVVFRPPHQPDSYYIQRIVALEGDLIELIDGHLAVNGDLLVSPDGLQSGPGWKNPMFPNLPAYPLTIPRGQAFVMGDNYSNSLDSRYFGPIPLDSISHIPHRIILPSHRAGPLNKKKPSAPPRSSS